MGGGGRLWRVVLTGGANCEGLDGMDGDGWDGGCSWRQEEEEEISSGREDLVMFEKGRRGCFALGHSHVSVTGGSGSAMVMISLGRFTKPMAKACQVYIPL